MCQGLFYLGEFSLAHQVQGAPGGQERGALSVALTSGCSN